MSVISDKYQTLHSLECLRDRRWYTILLQDSIFCQFFKNFVQCVLVIFTFPTLSRSIPSSLPIQLCVLFFVYQSSPFCAAQTFLDARPSAGVWHGAMLLKKRPPVSQQLSLPGKRLCAHLPTKEYFSLQLDYLFLFLIEEQLLGLHHQGLLSFRLSECQVHVWICVISLPNFLIKIFLKIEFKK